MQLQFESVILGSGKKCNFYNDLHNRQEKIALHPLADRKRLQRNSKSQRKLEQLKRSGTNSEEQTSEATLLLTRRKWRGLASGSGKEQSRPGQTN